ncbi:MAG: LysM peptidoglycan-binding domain-containing protein, partial [Saprospiraceae bacterium]
LSENTDNTEIYYQGDTGLDCKQAYYFRKSNRTTCGNFTDLAIIPEIGVVKYEEKTKVAGKVENLRTYTLQYVNNLPVDNYIGGVCQGNKLQDPILYVNKPVIDSTPASVPPAQVPNASTNSNPVASTPPVSVPLGSVPSVQLEEAKPQSYEVVTELVLDECDNPKKVGYHIVQADETLGQISKITGIPATALAKWNDIADENQIEVCSEIRLSPPSEITPVDYDDVLVARGGDVVTMADEPKNLNLTPCGLENHEGIHIVKKGETLYAIAKKYGYTAEKFMEINALENDVISPCMNLKTTNCSCPIDSDEEYEHNHDHDLVEKGEDEIPSEYGEPIRERKFHELATGDTLYGLSKKYDISVQKLLVMNEIEDA